MRHTYKYAKISYAAAVRLGLAKSRRRTSSGYVIINDGDLTGYGSGTFADKIDALGGTVLTALQARAELE